MKIKVKRLNAFATLPTKGTEGSACYDLYASEESWVTRMEVAKVRTGLAFEVPKGYEMEIRPRSGMSSRESIIIVNSPGTLDSDYRGELLILLRQISLLGDGYHIKQGDRIAQFKINQVLPIELIEVGDLSPTARGANGYGSTGR